MTHVRWLLLFSVMLFNNQAFSASAMLTLASEKESEGQDDIIVDINTSLLEEDIKKIKNAIKYKSEVVRGVLPTPTPLPPAELILSDDKYLKNKTLAELETLLEQRKNALDDIEERDQGDWIKKFSDVGVAKGVSFAPAGTGQQYKVELVRYNLRLGDNTSLPFMLAYGESTSDDTQDKNTLSLVDPTDGLSITFPFYVDVGDWDWVTKLCKFSVSNGFCRLGVEVNGAYKKYETEEDENEYDISGSLQAAIALRFPIELLGDTTKTEAGYLAVRAAYVYYENDAYETIIDLPRIDEQGNEIDYGNNYHGQILEVNWNIYEQFSINYKRYKFSIDGLNGNNTIDQVSLSKSF